MYTSSPASRDEETQHHLPLASPYYTPVGKNLVLCSRCVLDNTVDDIWFDEDGVCKYCHIHDEMEKRHPLANGSDSDLIAIVNKIKRDGHGKDFDCIVGISGGRDSTYTLLKAVELGLRPLAVHFDNGWNSEIAVSNIHRATNKLGVILDTHVADWEEFKDLQIAFLKASTPDADVPTDWAIHSVLYRTAAREGVRHILNGHSFRTEGTTPLSWTYMDGKYVEQVHKLFGKTNKLRSFPNLKFWSLIYLALIRRIRVVNILEFMDYHRDSVDTLLSEKLGWEYYGGHHHENTYTKFFQSYYLPVKFKIDKRKRECSALIRSGQITREQALNEVLNGPYEHEEDIIKYVAAKLDLSSEEMEAIMNEPIRSFRDYPNYLRLIDFFSWPIRLAIRLHILPHIVELKYLNR